METSGSHFVLRALRLDPRLDERLKHEAYVANISQNELMGRYLEVGISVVDTPLPKDVPLDPSPVRRLGFLQPVPD